MNLKICAKTMWFFSKIVFYIHKSIDEADLLWLVCIHILGGGYIEWKMGYRVGFIWIWAQNNSWHSYAWGKLFDSVQNIFLGYSHSRLYLCQNVHLKLQILFLELDLLIESNLITFFLRLVMSSIWLSPLFISKGSD